MLTAGTLTRKRLQSTGWPRITHLPSYSMLCTNWHNLGRERGKRKQADDSEVPQGHPKGEDGRGTDEAHCHTLPGEVVFYHRFTNDNPNKTCSPKSISPL